MDKQKTSVPETAVKSSIGDDLGAGGIASVAGSAFAKVSDVAQQAKSQASDAVASLASGAGASAREMIDEQVRAGADIVGRMAELVRAAADAMEHDAPGLARLTRSGAGRIDQLSRTLRGRSAVELMKDASEFTRQNPAAVFGVAALVGFVVYRTLTSASPVALNGAQNVERETGRGDRFQSRAADWEFDQHRSGLADQYQPGA